jgi:hypothetical protein
VNQKQKDAKMDESDYRTKPRIPNTRKRRAYLRKQSSRLSAIKAVLEEQNAQRKLGEGVVEEDILAIPHEENSFQCRVASEVIGRLDENSLMVLSAPRKEMTTAPRRSPWVLTDTRWSPAKKPLPFDGLLLDRYTNGDNSTILSFSIF